MKTYTVIASSEKEPKSEIMFAYNGQFGIETTSSESEANYFSEAIKIDLQVSRMFPGTTEEWSKYINECIIDTLTELGLTYSNVYGTFLN